MAEHPEIPYGPYCYEVESVDPITGYIKIDLCPYWHRDINRPQQNNGYCSYMNISDWDEDQGNGLLWDMIKECGINEQE